MKIDAETAQTLEPWFPDLDMQSVRLVDAWPFKALIKNVLRQGAVTVAPFIFYGKTSFRPGNAGSLALLAHELKHIEQYRGMGHAGFLWRYFWDKARNGFEYSKKLPLEKEAYDLQDEVRKALENP